MKLITEGNNKNIYIDGDKCIKVFGAEYSKSDVLNEALNQARIEEIGLNIPKVLEVTTIDGKWAIVTEFIKGKTLAQLMEENPEKKSEYIEYLVELQMEVHSRTCPLLNRLKDKIGRKLASTELDATTRYYLHARLEEMPKHNKVCHGDFNPSNIVITEDGTPYILDWSHAAQGNASADVARTYLLFWMSGDISGAETYLDIFCKKSDTDNSYVKKWMPIVAALQTAECSEKEYEFLMGWIGEKDRQ